MPSEVIRTGPLFDGRAGRLADQLIARLRHDVAQEAVNRIHVRLHQVLQHPTGHYESLIKTENQYGEEQRVTDDNCVYGPWLEGLSSRNYPNTRFKGYQTFRLVTQQMEAVAAEMAARTAAKLAEELNG